MLKRSKYIARCLPVPSVRVIEVNAKTPLNLAYCGNLVSITP